MILYWRYAFWVNYILVCDHICVVYVYNGLFNKLLPVVYVLITKIKCSSCTSLTNMLLNSDKTDRSIHKQKGHEKPLLHDYVLINGPISYGWRNKPVAGIINRPLASILNWVFSCFCNLDSNVPMVMYTLMQLETENGREQIKCYSEIRNRAIFEFRIIG